MQHPATPVLNLLTFQPERRITVTPDRFGIAYEDLYFTAADGVRINGWFVRAANPVGHILFAHGNAGNIGDRTPVLALLAAVGFDVLVFDYRGYGRSGGRPGERGSYLDARAAREALLRQPDVDPDRMLYLGKSLGGAVMIELATAFAPAGLMLMSTFTGLRDAARAVYPFLPWPVVPNAFPSLNRLRTVRAPVLIMHGDDDELLPVRMAHALYAAAPEPKRLKIFPGGKHNDLIMKPDWITTVSGWAGPVLSRTHAAAEE
ncbi:alpha/beta hydrolase [Nocardia terpenica]|uniref:alpha/beta hydrolase n=1 Tax=Nocardia terpenica TaxID=455432 RepID=UPI001893E244|nr:alpha/beta hydrolase [Nocardia terpenica]MBF6066383.1 alpha/beta hydrolase [Nocardia terpenica]MBF6109427.1 alpha/beta hydrolase [Nocardia terpenica]MBF6116630.1 alpha/beta hydrolase [Nocardia terpenica]MBF6123865.1 alpha/beta hydrolase [Nocardia terpenica]MBF6157205.1 alpha/beta hydrolase [Nocardia terpenica]